MPVLFGDVKSADESIQRKEIFSYTFFGNFTRYFQGPKRAFCFYSRSAIITG